MLALILLLSRSFESRERLICSLAQARGLCPCCVSRCEHAPCPVSPERMACEFVEQAQVVVELEP